MHSRLPPTALTLALASSVAVFWWACSGRPAPSAMRPAGAASDPADSPAKILTPATGPTLVDLPLATQRAPVGAGGVDDSGASDEPVTASVFLRVLDRATGASLASPIELWQLGLPEDEVWGPGDRLHGEFELPTDGLEIENLPLGRYRALVLARPRGAEDPPEFTLGAGGLSVELQIDLPRAYRLYLQVVDESGVPVEQAWIKRSIEYLGRAKAAFAKPRWKKGDEHFFGVGGGAGGSYRGTTRRPSERGFELHTWREVSCGSVFTRKLLLRPEGRGDVLWKHTGLVEAGKIPEQRIVGERDFLGVALPESWFDDALFLPDGRRARDAGASIQIVSDTVELRAGEPRPWLRVPIRVSAQAEGFRDLAFSYRLERGPPDMRVLEPE